MKRVIKKTGKSLWRVFRELDFNNKCQFVSASFGLITIICLFILILLLGFSIHWVFGIFLVLITLTLFPLFISGMWDDITGILYDKYYTVDYVEVDD